MRKMSIILKHSPFFLKIFQVKKIIIIGSHFTNKHTWRKEGKLKVLIEYSNGSFLAFSV